MNLKNKTFIVTGVARVGKAVAKAMCDKGANIVMSFLNNPIDLDFLEGKKKQSIMARADLSSEKDVEGLIKAAETAFGSVDGLVHMAATYKRNPWDKLNAEAWDKDMNDIARSAFLLGKLVGDKLLDNQGDLVTDPAGQAIGTIKGKIILFSDWSVLTRPYKEYLPYNVAKASVTALTKSLAKELAPYVTVNCIAPGPILRPDDLSDEENAEAIGKTLLQRWGGSEEIAKAVTYLLDADFMTGQVLHVDGGRTIA